MVEDYTSSCVSPTLNTAGKVRVNEDIDPIFGRQRVGAPRKRVDQALVSAKVPRCTLELQEGSLVRSRKLAAKFFGSRAQVDTVGGQVVRSC